MAFVLFLLSPFGRISRSSWWTIQLINSVLMIAIASILFTPILADPSAAIEGLMSGHLSLPPSLKLAISAPLWISFCATVKRYHDRGKSGMWALVAIIPVIGPVWQMIELGSQAGTNGANAFGEKTIGAFGTPLVTTQQNSSVGSMDWNRNMDDAIAQAVTDMGNQDSNHTATPNHDRKPSSTFGQAPPRSFGQRGLS